jgi:topoisomerase IA-like protein
MAYFTDDKYHNAVDISSINASITSVTESLNNAMQLYNQAVTAITACGNKASGCLAKTGRHISTWRDQRDRYLPIVEQKKAELKELLEIQSTLTDVQVTSASNQQIIVAKEAETNQVKAAADIALANADTRKAESTAKKYGLYIGLGLVLVIGGIVAFKMLKKKK